LAGTPEPIAWEGWGGDLGRLVEMAGAGCLSKESMGV